MYQWSAVGLGGITISVLNTLYRKTEILQFFKNDCSIRVSRSYAVILDLQIHTRLLPPVVMTRFI